MSRAFEFLRGHRSAAELTPAERGLATTVAMACKLQGMSSYQKEEVFRRYQHMADDIDQGGRFHEGYELHRGFESNLESCAQQESGKLFYARKAGMDRIAGDSICTDDIALLRETPFRKLIKGEPNEGCRLTLTTITQAAYGSSITVLVRDLDGQECLLNIYNFFSSPTMTMREAQALLPKGTELVVRAPYLKCSNTGMLSLRVDNPANIVYTHRPGLTIPISPSMTASDATAKAEKAKTAGNDHFAGERFAAAEAFYAAGLSLPADLLAPALRVALHSNRAAASLRLQRYASALADCDAALALDSAFEKAQLRRCDALLGLNRPQEALAAAQEKLKADPSSAVWSAVVAKASDACELARGSIDICRMPFVPATQVTKGLCDYIGPLAVKPTGDSRGWGLFVTRDVVAGEILLLERPLGIRFAVPNGAAVAMYQDNESDNLIVKGPSYHLTCTLTHCAQIPGTDSDGQLAAKLSFLSSRFGARMATEPPSEAALHGKEPLPPAPKPLSFRHVQGIVDTNAFHTRLRVKEPPPPEKEAVHASLTDPSQLKVLFDPRHATGRRVIKTVPKNELMSVILDAPDESISIVAGGSGSGKKKGKGGGGGGAAAPKSPLERLLKTMSTEQVEKCLAETDNHGMTALHHSVRMKDLPATTLLLARGASPNAKDELGFTPVHFAAGEDFNADILHALLESGGNPGAVSTRGLTPMHSAVACGRAEAVQMLLDAGADPTVRAVSPFSALDAVYDEDNAKLIKSGLDGCRRVLEASGYTKDRYREEVVDGTSLFWVASFINHHSKTVNTMRCVVGSLFALSAAQDLPAGTELLTRYSPDEEVLRSMWGIR